MVGTVTPIIEGPFATLRSGEVAGSVTAKQLPAVPCKMVQFKAKAANAGNVYLGSSAGVTKAVGSDSQTCGYQLAAGDGTDWIPADTVSRFWVVCDNAGDGLTYKAKNF